MPTVSEFLLANLQSIDRPGDFCIGGMRDIFMPAIDVDGVGRIAFPLPDAQATQLIAIAEAAPHGRGEKTVVDRDVRRTWQISPDKIRIGGRHWEQTLKDLVDDASQGLGLTEPVAADFYKFLIYDEGAFFVDHRDTEKTPGMFATLTIVLPSVHAGGELVIRHLGREILYDLRPDEPSEIGFAAFYADCVHEIRPVTAGYRPVLVYNLRFLGKQQPPKPPDHRTECDRIADRLRLWADDTDEPDKLILPLEHAYTPAELSFATLKGRDAGVASVLVDAAARADCDLHLALVSIEEDGSANYSGDYRGRGRRNDDDEDAFEVIEVFNRNPILSEWRRPDGGTADFQSFPFTEDELCPPDAFEVMEPDEQHFHEATGNEGASFERTYRRAGLVLWPRVRRLAVLNQAGLGATLPHLENLAARWEASGAGPESPLWREADELSGHMLSSWPRQSWRGEAGAQPGRMLDAQARFGNAARIDGFLADVSADGSYAAADNEAIVRAAALLPPARATWLLARIVERNAGSHLSGCADLLRRCVEAPPGSRGDPAKIGAALLDALPGDPANPPQTDIYQRPSPVTSDFVHDFLAALCQIDAALAGRAVERILAWPTKYKPDDILVPAALAFASHPGSRAWPAVGRLREASLAHLRARIALHLEAPRDWTRSNPVTCKCADCHALGAFLVDPVQRDWRLRAAADRRTHIENNVRNSTYDLDLTTERRGSPHTLIATKNQASYERRAAQRRLDLAHVSALEE